MFYLEKKDQTVEILSTVPVLKWHKVDILLGWMRKMGEL